LSDDSKTSDITSEGLGEMFEGDSADMCGGKFLLLSMRGRKKLGSPPMKHKYKGFNENPLMLLEKKIYEYQNTNKKKIL
jgi:hypothetical protein